MKDLYTAPVAEMVKIEVMDVIMTSNVEGAEGNLPGNEGDSWGEE